MTDILPQIASYKRREIAEAKVRVPRGTLEREIATSRRRAASSRRSNARREEGRFALIAEIKKASPSKGVIREHFDPEALAKAYQAGGATVPLGADRRALVPGRARRI